MQIVQGAKVNAGLLGPLATPDYSGLVQGITKFGEGIAKGVEDRRKSIVELEREQDKMRELALKDKYDKEYIETFNVLNQSRDELKEVIKKNRTRGLNSPEVMEAVRKINDKASSRINGIESFYKGSGELLNWAKSDPYTDLSAVEQAINEVAEKDPSERDPNWAQTLKVSPRTLNLSGFVASKLKSVKSVEEPVSEDKDGYMKEYRVQYNPALYKRVGDQIVMKDIAEMKDFVVEMAKTDPRFVAAARDKVRNTIARERASVLGEDDPRVFDNEIYDKDEENRAIEQMMPALVHEVISGMPIDGDLAPKKTLVKSDERTVSRGGSETAKEKNDRLSIESAKALALSIQNNNNILKTYLKTGKTGMSRYEVIGDKVNYWLTVPSGRKGDKISEEKEPRVLDLNDPVSVRRFMELTAPSATETTAVSPKPESGGKVLVISPDGRKGLIPSENLEAALKKGFKKAE
jgi:hypothetical protein